MPTVQGTLMRTNHRTRTLCTLGLAALLMTACGGSGAPAAAPSSPSPTASPEDPFHERAKSMDVGGGRHVYMQCMGVGSPTIVLESGDESDNQQWRFVYAKLVDRTRVCRYDRLGVGQSDVVTSGCRQLADLRTVLENALRLIGEKGPYVLVGTSGGGYLAAGFAYAHPALVRGMVLIETPRAIVPSKTPKELLAQIRCDAPTNVERRDYVRVENEAWSHRHRIGRIPMTVISNRYTPPFEYDDQRTNVADQRGWFVLSPLARQVVVTTGHNVPDNEPDLVVREVLRVLAAAS
jgi:pimeloyl-ACP methyl ester carboxylesterase